ncbi:hypothetical protein QQP08_023481 [Theobroma cacao]|uniref:Uncharacterized protein n=2 Tax=Theobroma cacao TaxID=3641 RepID=A0A061FQU7_THECC|nr:PREDICTED: uncharacterized protein LOC18592753 [Theobroma cacao]EOY16909.1 Uncharacterized protein TCM_035898 [Theobroma cacao]WRX30994.1 hypothetical protein QQP08_023481 [Theobroma cacao]
MATACKTTGRLLTKMETENPKETGEIEASTQDPRNEPKSDPNPRTVKTKMPEVEIRLYRRGKGPIDVFKSSLGGWDQDQLEVREILEKYGFKSIYAFNTQSGRGVPIRFHPRNGRSIIGYKDGSVVHIDGEPKDSLIKPITKILVGIAVTTLLIALAVKDTPEWIKKLNIFGGDFPPWVLACIVIVFTRMRKRTRDFLKKLGW